MLQLKNVSKFYYSKGVVTSGFSKVNLELDIGEFVAITGESGSGKSTLLNVLSGLDSYEEGEMYVEGEDTSAYSEVEWEKYRRKYISNIFQSFNLVNSYTVYQNVELALQLSGYREKDSKEKILEVLRKVDLYEYRNQRASRLSGGQKQRVAIARTLVRNTPIIVADEPTGNLDSKAAANVIEMLSRVAKDKLVLVVTHNYEQVENYVTRRITMYDGRVIEDVRLGEPSVTEEPAAAETETVARGVFEDTVRRIDVWQRLRLGVRNAFNIVPKFLLLLMVFLFVTVSAAGYYSSSLVAAANSTDFSYNYFFSNTSRQRIILKKADGTAFSKEDYDKIRNLENIESVHEDDLLLDSTVSFTGSYDLYGTVYALDTFSGTLDYGTMPTSDREVIVVLPTYHYLSQSAEEMPGQTLSIYDDLSGSTIMGNIEIAGVIVSESKNYDRQFYCSEAVLKALRSSTNAAYSTISVAVDGHTLTGTLVPSAQVKPGEALVSEEVDDFFADGSCYKEPMSIHLENLYYSADKSLTVTDTYNENNWAKKTGRPADYYEWQNGTVFINADDYAALFDSESYQSSVFVADTEMLHETAQELTDMGYTTLCMADTLVDDTSGYQVVMRVLTAIRTVVLFVATFFISYFVIRLIMKSRNTYFTTVRILGATRKDCGHLLFIDLTTVLCVAYLLVVGVAVLVKTGLLRLGFLMEFLNYLEPLHFAVLFAVLVLMCLLISLRYSRKLFKASAMKTYKEVG